VTARDWIEKDFYAELGVSSDAKAEELKKSYRKLARELHPDANPADTKAENRFKAVSEAYAVLSDPEKRREYDEARRFFRTGARPGGFAGGGPGGFGATFDLNDLFAAQNTGPGGFGDTLGGFLGRQRGGTPPNRPRRGSDVETTVRIDFVQAVNGATLPLRLTSPSTCSTCGGSGARPGTHPHRCPNCSGTGYVSTSQGAFDFSEPCRDCRGTGNLIDEPCPECGGNGISSRTRTITVRVPAGVNDGQRVRIAGRGEPGRNGAPAGDLFVVVHVNPHRYFGRDGNDLTLTVPVTFPEAALGTTVAVPTLSGRVSVRIPVGTTSGRVMRVRGKGVHRKDGVTGDLLITVTVAVPAQLDTEAREALEVYAAATETHNPRADLDELPDEPR
jgi:molecular chaperone DnaJ